MSAASSAHPVRQWPDMVLRAHCRELSELELPAFAALADRMRDLVLGASALGVAAPQLGVPVAMFAFRDPDGSVHVAVNPRLETGGAWADGLEGCLSLGRLTVPVRRRARARMLATDVRGEPLAREASGLWARVLAHEADHLTGTLILDHAPGAVMLSQVPRHPRFGFQPSGDLLGDQQHLVFDAVSGALRADADDEDR